MELISRRHFVSPWICLALVTYFSTAVLSRHHIRHHRDRFKRQHGANLYLPASYVAEGGDGEDAGPWSDWSSPTQCSRTCGGGVSTQYRQCQGYACSGPTTRHFSCNTQDCPDTGDFRAQQCSEYDNTPFEGVLYQWVPYTKGPNPCELNCMPRGERFYYRHKTYVTDGTRCNDETLDVCVQGKCQQVGCDMMLGSPAREDKCRQCGGDSSSCNTIEGLLDMQDMQSGYNDILLIPAGATNIRVQEIAPSNNYLAVRNTSGYYHLNGNWRIDFPRTLDFAGCKFHYERYPQGFPAPDRIWCLGPTDEALFIVLLFQDTNVGVRYEYSLPKTIQPSTDNETYVWTFNQFSPCSATCGGGIQYRNVSCAKRRDVEPADRSLCDASAEPPATQTCGETPCEPQWVVQPWGNCSAPCGEGGVQSRQIFCEQIISGGVPSLVDENECLKAGRKPDLQQACNQGVICAQWHTGPWKPCDRLCGEGKEKRQVTCYRKTDGKIEVLDDAQCEHQEKKPESERKCNLRPCEGVDWVTTEWSGCETKCGLANETRRVQCATADGEVYPNELCEDSPMPELVRPCKNINSSCEHQWFASQWSECSATCGDGVQTRTVRCAAVSDDGVKYVEDGLCDDSKKYDAIKNCTGEKEECTGEWFSGPWSKCSKECGGGERTRKVVCLAEGKVVNSSQCDANTIMFSSESCNKDACTEDTVIPVDVTASLSEFEPESVELLEPDYEIIEDDEECEDGEWVDADDLGVTYPFEAIKVSPFESTPYESSSETAFTASSDQSSGTSLASEDLMLSDSTAYTEDGHSTASDTVDTGSGDFESSPATESSVSPASGAADTDITELEEGSGEESSPASALSTTESAVSASEVSGASETTISATEASSEAGSSSDVSETTVGSSEGTTEASTELSTTSEVSTTFETTTDSPSTTEYSTVETTLFTIELTSEGSSTDVSTTESDFSTTELLSSSTAVSSEESSGSTVGLTSESGASTEQTSEVTEVSGTTEALGSTESPQSTEASASTEVSGSTEAPGSTESSVSTEYASTSSGETTESLESTTSVTTESGATETSGSTEFDIWSSTEPSTTEESSTYAESWETTTIREFLQGKKGKVCKKKKKPDCKTTKFGCCMDNITPAQGPFDKGCPITKTCNETTYGCCEDGVSPAKGKKFKGCPSSHCLETLFGCCPDNKTVATGNDNEGCPPPPPKCLKSKYGCCKDNVTEAKGPKQKGCEPEPEEAETTTFAGTTETPESCSNSTYGCCPDGVKIAEGEYFKGCDIFKENCSDSYFGCCPDGKTSAAGPNYKGCKTPCSDSPYGCCEDGITPSHGYNREGCCLATPHGCCPDNIMPARGPNLEGCDCHYLPYGCCPDNYTAATGYNNAGCGCQYSSNGCCPDEYTEASGPNYEGCLCHTYQFGCCPDGVTIAQGPHQQGCDCRYSEFGCCKDGQTPAAGANYTGCTCASSEFGCCLDGVTEAQGEKYEGCETAPENLQEYCSLEKERGSCRNYTVWWYYDTEYGGCSRFWYGGCEGNKNRFKTKDECNTVCTEPVGEDRCALPKITGPCEGYYPQWFYDKERKTCSQFIYGGCLGNNNRFETREECAELCVKDDTVDACEQPKEEGPCRGNYPKWFFEKESGVCREFIYGGCKGNNNNFVSESACKQRCAAPGRKKDHCSLPRAQGNCTEKLPRWYYDTPEGRCMPFYYSGCSGNGNNFISREACEADCPKEIHKDVCQLPAEVGECSNYTTRWYYNVLQKSCSQFYYGGCGGNGNNFYRQDLCQQRCEYRAPAPEPATPGPVYQPQPSPQPYPVTSAPAPPPEPQPQPDTGDAVCFEPVAAGSCNESIPSYFYDAANQRCASFTYTGCEGNANRYSSEEQCERQCGRFRQQDVCRLYVDPGRCTAYVEKYYYDVDAGRCAAFSFGGCEGNGNRFSSLEECETVCVTHEETKPNQTSTEICRLPVDKGPCDGGYYRRWYYDNERGECIPFIYSGCGGNFNRFKSFQNCIESCRDLLAQTEPPVVVEGPEREPHPCQAYFDECPTLRCPYGIEAYVDDNQCNRCQCHDPCKSVDCPEGSQCGIDFNSNRTTPQDPTFIAVCRLINKEGECPILTNNTNCEQECTNDAECTLDLKCCSNGCGTSCVEPAKAPLEVPAQLVTTALPAYTEAPVLSGYYPPTVDEEVFEPEVHAGEGDYATLKCAVKGNPTPEITWSKDDLLIDGKQPRYRILLDQSLQIVTLHKTDSGIYLCTADNKIGDPLRKEIRLTVSDSQPHAASVFSPEENVNVVTSLGAPATLNCDAIGYPFPAVTWWKDDSLIPLKTTQFEVRKDYSLLIHSIQISNLGVYTCQAYNGIGKAASWSVTVRALGPYHSSDPADEKYLKYIIDRPQPPPTTERPQYPYRPQYPFRPSPDYYSPTPRPYAPPSYTSPASELSENQVQPQVEPAVEGHRPEAGIYIHPKCTDNRFFANCALIVKAQICTHKYYARFCCRTCTKAGQLPSYGPHLDGLDDKHTAISDNLI